MVRPNWNRVELAGGVARTETKAFPSGSVLLTFSIALESLVWNKQTQAKETVTNFVWCERWLPQDFADDQLVYQGDSVHVLGQLGKASKPDGSEGSTRVEALIVTVLERGRVGRETLAGAQQPAAPRQQQTQQQRPAPQEDPWANQPSTRQPAPSANPW